MIVYLILALLTFFVIAIALSINYVIESKKSEDIKVAYVLSIREILEKCKSASSNEMIIAKLNDVLEELKYGDVNSSNKTSEIEVRIMSKAYAILDIIKGREKVDCSEILNELLKLITERNIITKNNK